MSQMYFFLFWEDSNLVYLDRLILFCGKQAAASTDAKKLHNNTWKNNNDLHIFYTRLSKGKLIVSIKLLPSEHKKKWIWNIL